MITKNLELPIAGNNPEDRIKKAKCLAGMSRHLSADQIEKLYKASQNANKVAMAMKFL